MPDFRLQLPLKKELLFFVLIIALAIFFRFWNLASLPPGLHPDEAANGLDIIRMIENYDFRPFYNTNGPREALFFYLQGFWVLLGLVFKIPALYFTPLALRVAPAIIGVFTVLVLYFLLKEWLETKWALIGAFTLSISTWHIQFSRNGFRAILVPLVTTLFFYFLTKAIKTKNPLFFGLSGLAFGLGFYTYLAFYMMVPLALIFLIYLFIWHRQSLVGFLKLYAKKIFLALAVAVVIYLPIGFYFFYHPGDQLARAAGVSVFNPDAKGESLSLLWENFKKSVLMFNTAGDANFRHNYDSNAMLDPILGIFFILGIGIALYFFKTPQYALLLFWWLAMLGPSVVTLGDIPHALRAVGAIPPVFIFIALGLREFDIFAKKVLASQFSFILIFMILVVSLIYSFQRYFILWADDPRTFEAYSFNMTSLGYYFKNLDPQINKYAIVNGYSNKTLSFVSHDYWRHPFSGPKFELGIKNNYQYLELQDIDSLGLNSGKYQFAIQPYLAFEAVQKLKSRFPNGEVTNFEVRRIPVFTIFSFTLQ